MDILINKGEAFDEGREIHFTRHLFPEGEHSHHQGDLACTCKPVTVFTTSILAAYMGIEIKKTIQLVLHRPFDLMEMGVLQK